jgi:lysozyme
MKRTTVRRTSKPIKKKSFFASTSFFSLVFFGCIGLFLYSKREALAYYLSFKTSKTVVETRIASLDDVLEAHGEKAFGIDISEYQDKIYWDKVKELQGGYPIEFVFVRATIGRRKKDAKFTKYWARAKEKKLLRGAYHYYRPNENSIEQADNFISQVKLKKGDFPPVLDIEKLPRHQSIDSLKVGLKRWLVKIEKHYGVKPIIYSSESYYYDFLKDDFEEYPFWIANYSAFYKNIDSDWSIWQITENAKVEGIRGRVDLNVYNGDSDDLKKMLIN